jgi:hypothetical protein
MALVTDAEGAGGRRRAIIGRGPDGRAQAIALE